MIPLLLLLLACADEPTQPAPSAVEQADAAAEAMYRAPAAPPAATAPDATSPVEGAAATDAPVVITFRWYEIASLYQGFLAQPVVTEALGRALRGVTTSPVRLVVSYDPVAVRGAIRMKLTEGMLLKPVRVNGDVIAVQDLAPIMVALAAYRKELGTRYDLRLLNFRVGVDATSSTVGCIFAPAGEPSSDGKVVSPCVEINGVSSCGVPGPEGVRFEPAAAEAIRSCLSRPVVLAN